MDRCQSKVGKAMCPADFLSKEVAALSGRIFSGDYKSLGPWHGSYERKSFSHVLEPCQTMGRQRNEDTVSLFRAARSYLFAHLPSAVVISPCMKKLQRIKKKRKKNKSSSWIMNIANLRRRMRPWLHQQSAVEIASAATETKNLTRPWQEEEFQVLMVENRGHVWSC